MRTLRILIFCIVQLAIVITANSQTSSAIDSPVKTDSVYKASRTIFFDLVHTKLDLKFDFSKSVVYGKAWVTVKPHFYSEDMLTLDAKGMDVKEISLVNGNKKSKLKFENTGTQLNISLNKSYDRENELTVYLDYTAQPEVYKASGEGEEKGVYFINPLGTEKDKPTQVWTDGEPEYNSVWCPTIDAPNQRCTIEYSLTVPDNFVTLSNGLMTGQKKNADGTRTDSWNMNLPIAPYLFFAGAGDFAIAKDSWKGKEVNYYVEKEYASVAKRIFGNTPEMISFFSNITGIEFPWQKYDQIVFRDYTAGAMENTTCVVHQEEAQQDARELVDENRWESTIAHELFHHWFGDLVTTESWSNITLNESFANYSEYLWLEHKYGKEKADEHFYTEMKGYLDPENESKELVRFYYNKPSDLFDAVSYNKGGCVLNMLRRYVGDSAFFKSLNLYLTTNKFKSAEVPQLRLAFEEITGQDLNWFFNEWYYGSGNPRLNINYTYNSELKKEIVTVEQTQKEQLFRMPVAIDIYNGDKKQRYNAWIKNAADTFEFKCDQQPDLVNFDADKYLVCTKTENKTLAEYAFQYHHGTSYMDKREAIDGALKEQVKDEAIALLKEALNEEYPGLKKYLLDELDMSNPRLKNAIHDELEKIAKTDKSSLVRAAAISKLGWYADEKCKPFFMEQMQDSSYSVAGAALEALAIIDEQTAVNAARDFAKQNVKGKLNESAASVLMTSGNEDDFDLVVAAYNKLEFGQSKLDMTIRLTDYLARSENVPHFKKAVDLMQEFQKNTPSNYQWIKDLITRYLTAVKAYKQQKIAAAKDKNAIQEQIDYLSDKLK